MGASSSFETRPLAPRLRRVVHEVAASCTVALIVRCAACAPSPAQLRVCAQGCRGTFQLCAGNQGCRELLGSEGWKSCGRGLGAATRALLVQPWATDMYSFRPTRPM